MDKDETEPSRASISRREALQRGAIVGVTALWVTPVVQTIGMSRASAQTTSGTGGGHVAARPGKPEPSQEANTGGATLALTGLNAQHAVELGVAATTLGLGLTVASRVRKRGDEQDPAEDGTA